MVSALSYVTSNARKYDRDRFLCSIFTSEEERNGLFAILAFNLEIAKTREMVREGLLGEVRLQWWRDTIELIYSDPENSLNDGMVASALSSVIRKFKLSRGFFDQLIDTRSKDLFVRHIEDETELYDYTYGTSATICLLFLEILCPASCSLSHDKIEAAKSIGVAWALTGILRASNVLAKQKRIYIPKTLMKKFCFNEEDFYAQSVTDGIMQATEYVVNLAQNEILRARNLLKGKLDRKYLAVIFQAELAEMYLNKIELLGFNPFSDRIESGRVRRQLQLAFMALRGSF